MDKLLTRPASEATPRLAAVLGPHFAEYFADHFDGFGLELVDLGLCNKVALLLADYEDTLPVVARKPWRMSLTAFRADLMPSIVADRDAAKAAALWELIHAMPEGN